MDLTWLLLLMCPLMMIPMFFMMMKGNHGDKQQQPTNGLNQELEELKKQKEIMLQEINQLKGQNQ